MLCWATPFSLIINRPLFVVQTSHPIPFSKYPSEMFCMPSSVKKCVFFCVSRFISKRPWFVLSKTSPSPRDVSLLTVSGGRAINGVLIVVALFFFVSHKKTPLSSVETTISPFLTNSTLVVFFEGMKNE